MVANHYVVYFQFGAELCVHLLNHSAPLPAGSDIGLIRDDNQEVACIAKRLDCVCNTRRNYKIFKELRSKGAVVTHNIFTNYSVPVEKNCWFHRNFQSSRDKWPPKFRQSSLLICANAYVALL